MVCSRWRDFDTQSREGVEPGWQGEAEMQMGGGEGVDVGSS